MSSLIRFVDNSHVYHALKSNCFIAACAIGSHKALINVYIPYLAIYNEIVENLKFFMFFPGIMIMISAS